MKKCLLCEKKLGWVKFKTADGYLCKTCYGIASLNYTRTITRMTLTDLEKVYQQAQQDETMQNTVDFDITRRINGYVLFDDSRQILCLPNNSRFAAAKLKSEYYPYEAVRDAQILDQVIMVKEKQLHTLQVQVDFSKPQDVSRRIVLIPKPIEAKASVYHTMYNLAEQMAAQLRSLRAATSLN